MAEETVNNKTFKALVEEQKKRDKQEPGGRC